MPPRCLNFAQHLQVLLSSMVIPSLSAIVVDLGHALCPNLHWSNVLGVAPMSLHQFCMHLVDHIEEHSHEYGTLEFPAGSAGCSRKAPFRLLELLEIQIIYMVLSSSALSPSVLWKSAFRHSSCKTGKPHTDLFGSSSLLPYREWVQ